MQQIQATVAAFAAILADGSVVAWGDRRRGGDCSRVVDACVQYGFHCGRGQ